ncbi:hypothetical protein RJ639_034544 [Escallonia herrerae]|uniref:BRO1 domain-containing protein n=1 Tax=Escallonia herrerae TaxID=1293975 RepID=A0AA88X7R6_9ASTE|nr:hypothetical protein RJ639_034544 [Escallonia herrerae]
MMLHFKDFSKLKTKRIVFEEVYAARDSDTLEQLKELSSKRRVIEESINESSLITEAIAREMLFSSLLLFLKMFQETKKLEQYLPLLENLIQSAGLNSNNSQLVRWTSDLKIRWTSVLTSSTIFNRRAAKFFQIDDLHFELSMTLSLYGALLRGLASKILSADLVQSTTIYRKAAGVYHHLAHEVLPSLQSASVQERPPEATSCVSSVMSLICLAEAQSVTIRKAEEKGSTRSLLAKLHYGVVQLLDEAMVVLHSATEDCKDISGRFLEYISCCKDLYELRSYKCLGESTKTDGQIGIAIGLLRQALVVANKNIPEVESWRLVFKQEINNLTAVLRKYEHENEFVWHEKVPTHSELPFLRGKKIVSSIPYNFQRWERSLAFKF